MNVRDLVPWVRGDRDPSTRTGPMSPVLSLHREMNRLFDDVFRGFDGYNVDTGRGGWPSVDVEENDKEYRVTAELPGMEERDVEVLFQNGVIAIRGEKQIGKETGNRTFSERFYGRFERQIALDHEVDDGAISATFQNGVLGITIPKSSQSIESTKRIPINSRGQAC